MTVFSIFLSAYFETKQLHCKFIYMEIKGLLIPKLISLNSQKTLYTHYFTVLTEKEQFNIVREVFPIYQPVNSTEISAALQRKLAPLYIMAGIRHFPGKKVK